MTTRIASKLDYKTFNVKSKCDKTQQNVHPLFSVDYDGGGLDNLSPSLTINGSTETPVFVYRGDGATADVLEPETYGETLDRYGNAPTLDEPTPLLDDVSFKFAGDGYYRARNSTFADIGTEDIVFEMVFKTYDNDASSRIFWKDSDGVAYKIVVMSTKTLRFVIDPGTAVIIESDNLDINTWYHVIFFVDRSGSGQWYVNSAVSGDAIDVSSYSATLSNVDTLTVCSSSDGVDYASSSNIAYAALWKKENWLDTHLQAAIAKERFAKLLGLYPERYYGTALPEVIQRDSVAYLDTYQNNGTRQLFLVGDNWLRTIYDKELYDIDAYGLLIEPEKLNYFLYSEDFSQDEWTEVGCDAYQGGGVILPNGLASEDYIILHEDLSNGNHHYKNNNIPGLVENTYYCISVFVKAIGRNQLRISIGQDGDPKSAKFYLSDGTSVENQGPVGHGIIPYKNGWYRCWMSFLNDITSNVQDTWFYAQNDNDSASYQGEDIDALYIWGAQMEEGTYPSSYYPTAGSTASRSADLLRYNGDNVKNICQGSIKIDVLFPSFDNDSTKEIINLNDGGSGADLIAIRLSNTNDYPTFVCHASGLNDGYADAISDITDNQTATIEAIYKTNNAKIYINDGYENEDLSCGIPDDIDRIEVGCNHNQANQCSCLIKNIKIHNTKIEEF